MPFANLMLVIVLTVQVQNAEDARSLIHQAQDAMKRVAASPPRDNLSRPQNWFKPR